VITRVCSVPANVDRFDLGVVRSVDVGLDIFQGCALSEITIPRAHTRVAPNPALFTGMCFPLRSMRGRNPRWWIASIDTSHDIVIVTSATTYERVPADRVLVLHHYPVEV
jgi:hypothetical protein